MFPVMKTIEYFTPQRKVFGVNAVDRIGQYIHKMGLNGKAVIVTDPQIKSTGTIERITRSLKKEKFNFAVFDRAVPEPNDTICDEAADFARQEKGDFVIGVGGAVAWITGKSWPSCWNFPVKQPII